MAKLQNDEISRAARMTNAQACTTLAAAALLVTCLLTYSPSVHAPFCPFRRLTGLPCPGCGITRCWLACWHGHAGLAFRYHPIGMVLFGLSVGLVLMAAAGCFIPLAHSAQERLANGLLHPSNVMRFAKLLLVWWAVRLALWWAGNRFFLG